MCVVRHLIRLTEAGATTVEGEEDKLGGGEEGRQWRKGWVVAVVRQRGPSSFAPINNQLGRGESNHTTILVITCQRELRMDGMTMMSKGGVIIVVRGDGNEWRQQGGKWVGCQQVS
jgi:hypothetical protein